MVRWRLLLSAGIVCVIGRGAWAGVVTVRIADVGATTVATVNADGLEVQGAGVAGTPAGGVVSIQGVTSGTVIPISIGQTTTQNDVDVLSIVSGTGATNLGKAEDAVAATGDVGIMSLGVVNADGTALAGLEDDYVARAADTAGRTVIVGSIAHSSASNGNPVLSGAYVEAYNAAMDSTGVVDADATRLKADEEGRLYVRIDHAQRFQCKVGAVSARTQCQAAPGAGSLYITDMIVSMSAAGNLKLEQGTGTNCATTPTDLTDPFYFAANAGFPKTFTTPLKVTATQAVCCTPSVASGTCLLLGYTAP